MTTTTAGQQIKYILVLAQGETPWAYRTNPGELTGPWGDTPEQALAQYTADTGFGVVDYWSRGDTLWIVSDEDCGEWTV